MPIVRYWLLTHHPAGAIPQRGHGDVPVEARLGGVVSVTQQREAVDRVGSGRLAERPAAPVALAVTYDSETTSSRPARLRVITVRCAHGQNQPAYR